MRSRSLYRRLVEPVRRRRPEPDMAAARRRLAEITPLAQAEHAMAEGCPTEDQELMLMAAGSQAHRARRHPCLRRRQPAVRRVFLGR
jgi:hypothetical protein